ncbi:YheC/YheD family protein [Paenibacillus rhizoplanae]
MPTRPCSLPRSWGSRLPPISKTASAPSASWPWILPSTARAKIYVLEVNPKPAREVFARSGDNSTYHKALVRPLEYAMWVYKNKNTPSSSKVVEE